MSEYAIEAINLVKKFTRKTPPEEQAGVRPKKFKWPSKRNPTSWFTAVDDVSLHIERGEIFGLLGPNGAGKSTTIRMLCTLLEPTSGTARLNGYDTVKEPNMVRQSLGTVLAGERSIYWKLTGRENLEYFAALYHIPAEIAKKRINELLEHMELTSRANELVEKYSTGMRQRIVLSRALLARPPILLFDEPTLGLDPQAARHIREMIQELKRRPHRPPDHPLHGRGRPAFRPHRHHRPGQDHRPGYAQRAQTSHQAARSDKNGSFRLETRISNESTGYPRGE